MNLARRNVLGSCQRGLSQCRSYSTAVAGGGVEAARLHCENLLKQYDYPSYINRAFIPPPARDAYVALYALNVDVARVADTTNHPSIGTMRMQFWRDAVNKALAGTPPAEPVAVLLAHAAEDLQWRTDGQRRLNKSWLHRLINTREKYLGNKPFTTIDALETYAENTYSTLMYLTLSAFPLQSVTADHLASHIGKAVGISAVLRGLPLIAFPGPPPTHHTSNALRGATDDAPQGAVLLPLDVMAEVGLQEEEVFRQGANAPNLKDAVFTVATRANDHLITTREMLKNLQKGQDVGHEFEHADEVEHGYGETKELDKQLKEAYRGFGALMPAISTGLWLGKLEKADFDIFDRTLTREWKLPISSWWAYRQKKL